MQPRPKKRRHKAGRRVREKIQRRLERERLAAEAARQNNPGSEPQLNTGVAAGPDVRIPRQTQPHAVSGGGSGAMAPEASCPAKSPQEGSQGFQTALFDRRDETRSDARLARRAILNRWRPKPEATEAVLTKATMMALDEHAKVNDVIAVGKLHLDAHKTLVGDEHHGDRMDYYERALALRANEAGIPGTGIQMETDGPAKVTVYLPNNRRGESLDDDLRPEDLLKDDDG